MINIVIGSHKRFERVEPVIEYSILKHASEPVNIIIARPEYFNLPDSGCTGFSDIRKHVPTIMNFQSSAIYLDVDMLLVSDIAELWEMRRPGKHWVMLDGATEVAVMDCRERVKCQCVIPREWNVTDWNCELEQLETAKLLHFTDLKNQPWFYEHPKPWLADIWYQYEREAHEKNPQSL